MGFYINKGDEGFRQIRNSEYVDKSGLIAVVNGTLFTERKLSCVSRSRRFGKSMAAKMLAAYYYARNDFIMIRELPTGKGCAGIVFLPRKNVNKPVLVIELKKDTTVCAAIDQIKERHYPQQVETYTGDMLLVGISYDTQTKQHSCRIEQWRKE